jgi:hypothetical protein
VPKTTPVIYAISSYLVKPLRRKFGIRNLASQIPRNIANDTPIKFAFGQ